MSAKQKNKKGGLQMTKAKAISLILVIMLIGHLCVSFAAASNEPSNNSYEKEVPVVLNAKAALFDVEVPTSLELIINSEGEITTSTDAKVINNSYGPIKIDDISVETKDGWSIVPMDTKFENTDNDLSEFGFEVMGNEIARDGSCKILETISIAGHSERTVDYEYVTFSESTPSVDTVIANVLISVAWDTVWKV